MSKIDLNEQINLIITKELSKIKNESDAAALLTTDSVRALDVLASLLLKIKKQELEFDKINNVVTKTDKELKELALKATKYLSNAPDSKDDSKATEEDEDSEKDS